MRCTCVTRRCAARSLLDLALVTGLLVVYGSSPWAWLGGPVSAVFIWTLECSGRVRPQRSTSTRTRPGTAPTALESSASQG